MSAAPGISIIDAVGDPALFAPWFKHPETWRSWFSFLRVLFGLEVDESDLALFGECTSRDVPAEGGYKEAWLVGGRRGGKAVTLALIAALLATFVDWSPYLLPSY